MAVIMLGIEAVSHLYQDKQAQAGVTHNAGSATTPAPPYRIHGPSAGC